MRRPPVKPWLPPAAESCRRSVSMRPRSPRDSRTLPEIYSGSISSPDNGLTDENDYDHDYENDYGLQPSRSILTVDRSIWLEPVIVDRSCGRSRPLIR